MNVQAARSRSGGDAGDDGADRLPRRDQRALGKIERKARSQKEDLRGAIWQKLQVMVAIHRRLFSRTLWSCVTHSTAQVLCDNGSRGGDNTVLRGVALIQ